MDVTFKGVDAPIVPRIGRVALSCGHGGPAAVSAAASCAGQARRAGRDG